MEEGAGDNFRTDVLVEFTGRHSLGCGVLRDAISSWTTLGPGTSSYPRNLRLPVSLGEKHTAVTMQSMGAPDGEGSTTASPTTPMSSLITAMTPQAL